MLSMPANSVCIKETNKLLKCTIKTREHSSAMLVPLMELCIFFYLVGSQVGIDIMVAFTTL